MNFADDTKPLSGSDSEEEYPSYDNDVQSSGERKAPFKTFVDFCRLFVPPVLIFADAEPAYFWFVHLVNKN